MIGWKNEIPHGTTETTFERNGSAQERISTGQQINVMRMLS